ncbi:MAG: PTPDL family protein [Verrucomicrobiota bacterium]
MLPRIVLVTLALNGCLLADTITLKSGGTLEGEIISEDAEKVVIRVGERIRENKTVPFTEIEKIDRVAADKLAFDDLQGILDTPELLPARDYDKLTWRPEKFLKDFPDSAYADEVKKMFDTLVAEKAKVAAGAVKLGGEWIEAEDIARDPYNHEASMLKLKMDRALEDKDYVTAFSAFGELNGSYGESIAYAKAIPPAVSALDEYDKSLDRLLVQHEREITRREEQLRTRPASEKAQIEADFQRSVLGPFQKKWTEAKEANHTWLPVNLWSKESIMEAKRVVGDQRGSLASLDADNLLSGAEELAKAAQSLADGNFDEADKLLVESQKYLTYGDQYGRLQQGIIDGRTGKTSTPETPEEPTEPTMAEATETEETTTEEPSDEPAAATATESAPAESTVADEESGGIQPWMYLAGLVGLMAVLTILLKGKKKSGDEAEEE